MAALWLLRLVNWLLEKDKRPQPVEPPMTTQPTTNTRTSTPKVFSVDPASNYPMPEEHMTLADIQDTLTHWTRNYRDAATDLARAKAYANINLWLDARNRMARFIDLEQWWKEADE